MKLLDRSSIKKRLLTEIISLKGGTTLDVGKNIRTVRESRELSQSELAQMIGVTQKAISLFEQGRLIPNLRMGKLVADALGVTLDDLVKE